MAFALEERFEVATPPGPIWAVLLDPRRLVACMPGGELTGQVDATRFDGRLRVRLGLLSSTWSGRLQVADADQKAGRFRLEGEARGDEDGGQAHLTLLSRLEPREDGITEVVVMAHVEVGGRVARLGDRLLERLAQEVLRDFAEQLRRSLAPRRRPPEPTALPVRGPPLRLLPLAARALRGWLAGRPRGRVAQPAA